MIRKEELILLILNTNKQIIDTLILINNTRAWSIIIFSHCVLQ